MVVIVASLLIQESVINILVGVKTIRLTRDFVNLPTTRGLLVIETRGRVLDRRWKGATIQIPKFYITQSIIHTTHTNTNKIHYSLELLVIASYHQGLARSARSAVTMNEM